MKDALYFLQVALEAVFGTVGIRLYEEPPHAVVATLAPQVEVRRYAPRLAAEVEVDAAGADGRAARDAAFQLLFRYIAGANRAADGPAKVAMTVPVEVAPAARIAMTVPVETASAPGTVRMRFFLPAAFSATDAPVPEDPRVRLVEVPSETLGVLRFGGHANLEDEAARQRELLAALETSDWRATGTPFAYYYDSPFTIPFLRRNEAAVRVEPR